MDSYTISLRVSGEGLDPDRVTVLLQCNPTTVQRNRKATRSDGSVISQGSQWEFTLESKDYREDNFDAGLRRLLNHLTTDLQVWSMLTREYKVDLFCGLFLDTENRGFGLTVDTARLLAERNLPIGFDIYAPATAVSSL